MSKQIILHIGTHKTGTTSLQAALGANRDQLKKQGADYYQGVFTPNNHSELFLSTLRDGVDTFAGLKHPVDDKQDFYEKTRANVATFLGNSGSEKFIFSSEGLSYLRTEAECLQLKDLFPNEDLQFKIIVVLRNKDDFLASYKAQIVKNPERKESSDPRSGFYVEDDTWLVDFETMIQAYRSVFSTVTIIPYQENELLGLILKEMGVELNIDESAYRKNVSHKRRNPFWKRLFRRGG